MTEAIKPGDHVFLVDGSSFVFRAYFQSIKQDRKYNYRSDSLPTGAVRLFCAKLLQFVRDGAAGVKPTHLAIIFDKSENSFRKEIYPDYKANRSEPPDDLVPQFPLFRCAVRAFGMTPVEQDVYEADDLIATYARQAREAGADVLIVSADKDLMQLIGPKVAMYDPASGERDERKIGEAEVVDYFGVPPKQVVDVQALAGDSTDNVPGAPGVGVKTAAQLLGEYGDLDTLLARAGEIKQPKRRATLTDPAIVEKIRISKKLVALVDDVAVETPLADLRLVAPDAKELIAFLKAMEFTTITRRVAELYDVDAAEIEPDQRFLGPAGWRGRDGDPVAAPCETPPGETPAPASPASPAKPAKPAAPKGEAKADASRSGEAAAIAAKALEAARTPPIDRALYKTVTSADELARWLDAARAQGYLAFDTETDSLDPVTCGLVGVSLALAPGEACYIPLAHRAGDADDLFGGGPARLPGQMDEQECLALLRPILEDASILKIAQNVKFDELVLAQRGIAVSPCDDTMLMSYVLDSGRNGHGMDELAGVHLNWKTLTFGEVAGTGRSFKGFDRVAIDKATEYSAEDAEVTLRLWMALKPRLAAEGLAAVYERLERPLPSVLQRMERRGIMVDRAILARLSGEFAQAMAGLEAEIHGLAGESFNLGSPKQLGDILFGKFGLPGAKKTATGAWSTAAGVLEDLAEQGHDLPAKILDWRQMAKLKSTYADALPTYQDGEGRVHTSYSMASTSTGRLSSSEPNLQNIPVRNEMGRKIRAAFVAPKGRLLMSADYSQIELRLLAHIADIPQLKRAFENGLDIHAMTASEMFGVPVEGMPGEVRRRAKAINFGIIYGISAFGLANQLGIPREEAGAYIKKYFERFPGIRDYMEATKKQAKADGFVTTIFGRRMHFPRIASSNPSERAFNERAAINAPIQGSAADIIRRAMIRMDDALAAARVKSEMLLQVHDELVFEVDESEVEATIKVARAVMEDAPHPAVRLTVPLQVDARAARNWDEAH